MPDNEKEGGLKLEHIRPEIRVEESTPQYGKIVVEPLERGYGVTLGNALRRVLLSSIKGASITAVRIEGIVHEFSTIEGVREDVIELILNLKHIPVKSHASEVKILRLEAVGPKVVTVKDIQPDSQVEFVDPDAVVCHLADGAKVEMDIYVENGTGYASPARPRPTYLPVDALMVDGIFSPVKRVKYEVQDARVGQRTDYERLILDVWTNGVVQPDEAVAEAAGILEGYFARVKTALGRADLVIPQEPEEPEESEDLDESSAMSEEEKMLLAKPIKELELSIRSENCLLRGGVHTVGDLISKGRNELLKIRNLGKISLREIEEKLKKYGLELQDGASEDKSEATSIETKED